jgi:hypothetical protein
MANIIKIDNAVLKRRVREEKKRKTEFKSKRKFYLIVCEGEKTEPNYFESLKSSLPKGVLELTNIAGRCVFVLFFNYLSTSTSNRNKINTY